MNARRRSVVFAGAAGLLMIAVIFVLVNVLGNWLFFRIDLTHNHAYSLSPSSKRLVRDLSGPVIIKAYFTPDLPAPYNTFERYTRDLLSEYRSASRGKVRFEFVLPNPPEEFEKKATEAGLQPIQFEQLASDQFQMRRGYMGLVLFYRDKTETLPIVKDVGQLEYDVTSRIAKMASRVKKTIAYTSGHGELSLAPGAGMPSRPRPGDDARELYDFTEWSLPRDSTAPVHADAIIVAGPKQKLDDKSLWAIDQALMRGVPVGFLVDIRNLMVNQFYVSSLDAGLTEMLRHYGVTLGDRLVLDAQCETIGVTQNMSGFAFTTSLRYPYIPLVDRIMPNQALTRGLDSIGLPFPTTVDPLQPMPSGLHFSPLMYTSQRSWLAPAQPYASVAPGSIQRPKPDEPHGPYSVAGVVEGSFTSYFSGKAIPIAGQTLIGTSPKTQIVVLGTSKILDPSMPAFPGSDAFVSNLYAYLSHDETLLGIRSKGDIIRPLKPVSQAAQEFVKYGTVLGVAALPVLIGLWRWRSRQSWRQVMTAAFAPKGAS